MDELWKLYAKWKKSFTKSPINASFLFVLFIYILYIQNEKSTREGDGTPLQDSCLENPLDAGAWWAAVHEVTRGRTQLNDFPFTVHFHALEKEMATHSTVLAWRIPGTGEPSGLPSIGSHWVRHYWSNLPVAVAGYILWCHHLNCHLTREFHSLPLANEPILNVPCHLPFPF